MIIAHFDYTNLDVMKSKSASDREQSNDAEKLTGLGRIEKLLAREYWRGERLISQFCVVLVQTDRHRCKIYWDDEEEKWATEPVSAEIFQPIESFEIDGQLWRYPDVDLADRYDVCGQEITSLLVNSNVAHSTASMKLETGIEFCWFYDFATEEERLQVIRPSA